MSESVQQGWHAWYTLIYLQVQLQAAINNWKQRNAHWAHFFQTLHCYQATNTAEALNDEDSDIDDVEAASGNFKGSGGGDSNDALQSSTGPTENKLMFVHRETWQQELLK